MRNWNYLTTGERLGVEAVCNHYYKPKEETNGAACTACPLQAICRETAGRTLSPNERQSWETQLAHMAIIIVERENGKPKRNKWTRKFERYE